jgi:hypothetical protein
VAAEWRQGVARRSVALAEASRLSGGSEGPLAVMLIPHDRADLRRMLQALYGVDVY